MAARFRLAGFSDGAAYQAIKQRRKLEPRGSGRLRKQGRLRHAGNGVHLEPDGPILYQDHITTAQAPTTYGRVHAHGDVLHLSLIHI